MSAMSKGEKAVRVAIIAAVISALGMAATWTRALPVVIGWFVPFSPVVTTGAPTLGSVKSSQLTVLFNFKVSNGSRRSGCIRDFAIRLESLMDKRSWTLFPIAMVNMSDYARLTEERKNPLGSVRRMFSPLPLSGYASVEESFLFMHRPPTEDPKDILQVNDLKPDHYRIQLSILEADSSCSTTSNDYRSISSGRIDFTLNSGNINLLQNGGTVTPLEESLDSTRRKKVLGN